MACILLLCLQAHDFPVDTNVGRICARMGWLPFDQEKPLEVGLLARCGYGLCWHRLCGVNA